MFDFIIQHQALIRELINGFCMVLFLTVSILIIVLMWDTATDWYAKPVQTSAYNRARTWTTSPGIPTACALWWVFAAEAYRCGAIWTLYNIGKHRHMSPYPTANATGIGVFGEAGFWSSFGYLIAGFMLAGGLLRSIYIFTPPEWKRQVWVYAALAGVVFCSTPSMFTLARTYLYGF